MNTPTPARPALDAMGDDAVSELLRQLQDAVDHWTFGSEEDASLIPSAIDMILKLNRECVSLAAGQLRDRADFMHREGYRECDIAACNCGSWHGGHAANRLREISDIVPHNGILLRDAIAALVDLGHNGLRELLEAMLEYFEDRSDISGPNERVPNQEMRFAEEIKAALKELKR